MPSSGYTAISFTAGEQPTTAKWNLVGSNDASFNNGNGFNDNILITRHFATSGLQLPDKVLNPYKFSVYLGSAQNLAGGASYTKILFDTKEFDTGSNFDAVTNHRFTAPIAGFYFFSAAMQVATTGTADQFTIILYKNGSAMRQGMFLPGGGAIALDQYNVSTLMQLNANDYIEAYGFCNQAGTRALSTSANTTYFQGFLVSAT